MRSVSSENTQRAVEYYSVTGLLWGHTRVLESDRRLVALVEQHLGKGSWRILELGAGFGGAAAAAADAGHNVVAVELSPVRFRFLAVHADRPHRGTLKAILDDIHTVSLDGCFDAVCYWNGFGVADDAGQRNLLGRIARDWLSPTGVLLMHVYSESWWTLHAGTSKDRNGGYVEDFGFDVNESRLIHRVSVRDVSVTESIRCYSPADLRLLIEPTGLRIDSISFATNDSGASAGEELTSQSAWKYLATLRRIESA